ncbi:hypothetical protein TNCV_1139101 [Trichonephila clavipes]|nr:hypothetical protein TNCV_1139101 [Trichonephila clavipes]
MKYQSWSDTLTTGSLQPFRLSGEVFTLYSGGVKPDLMWARVWTYNNPAILLWTRSFPMQLTVALHIQWQIVIKGDKGARQLAGRACQSEHVSNTCSQIKAHEIHGGMGKRYACRTVTCMVLKANDRRTSCSCHDEFRGPLSDYVRQVALENNNTFVVSEGSHQIPHGRTDF